MTVTVYRGTHQEPIRLPSKPSGRKTAHRARAGAVGSANYGTLQRSISFSE